MSDPRNKVNGYLINDNGNLEENINGNVIENKNDSEYIEYEEVGSDCDDSDVFEVDGSIQDMSDVSEIL